MSSLFCRKRQVQELQSWPQAGFGVYKYSLQKSQGEKRCEIKGGGQEMAVMVG